MTTFTTIPAERILGAVSDLRAARNFKDEDYRPERPTFIQAAGGMVFLVTDAPTKETRQQIAGRVRLSDDQGHGQTISGMWQVGLDVLGEVAAAVAGVSATLCANGGTLRLQANGVTATVGYKPNKAPALPDFAASTTAPRFEMGPESFDALRCALDAAAKWKDGRSNLAGVMVFSYQGAAWAAGTNGHFLNVARLPGVVLQGQSVVHPDPVPAAWLHRSVVKCLISRPRAAVITVESVTGLHHMQADGTEWTWKGEAHVNWPAVHPKGEPRAVVPAPVDLRDRLAVFIATDHSLRMGVSIQLAEGVATFRMREAETSFPCPGAPDAQVKLSPSYLSRALGMFKTDARIEIRQPLDPVVVRGPDGFALIMPMRE